MCDQRGWRKPQCRAPKSSWRSAACQGSVRANNRAALFPVPGHRRSSCRTRQSRPPPRLCPPAAQPSDGQPAGQSARQAAGPFPARRGRLVSRLCAAAPTARCRRESPRRETARASPRRGIPPRLGTARATGTSHLRPESQPARPIAARHRTAIPSPLARFPPPAAPPRPTPRQGQSPDRSGARTAERARASRSLHAWAGMRSAASMCPSAAAMPPGLTCDRCDHQSARRQSPRLAARGTPGQSS